MINLHKVPTNSSNGYNPFRFTFVCNPLFRKHCRTKTFVALVAEKYSEHDKKDKKAF